ncbi:unnamed protein product [Moneuplotes crassus]|uniref:Protein kinase domain-containing protein n=1 Tax=Euplotes crassus TaxID=5936 RepID=A0AAD1XS76_EUPCR|nr:unnamed protein product [Moneuplotes crassus]
MGNLTFQDKKSYKQLFFYSLESSYINVEMLEEMRQRWKARGRPLYMIPQEFKEGILLEMESNIKLNYLKWTTSGLEIDILIMFITLALFAQDTIEKRISILFRVFSISSEDNMSDIELRYMIEKTLCAISNTLSIKRDHLFEIYKTIESKIGFKKIYSQQVFRELIEKLLKDLTYVLDESYQNINQLVDNLKEEKINKYFELGSLFLGKYKITEVSSYRSICRAKKEAQRVIDESVSNKTLRDNETENKRGMKTISRSMSSEESKSHKFFIGPGSSKSKYLSLSQDHLLNHFYVNNLEYAYRIKTIEVYGINDEEKSFDILMSHTTNKIYCQLLDFISSRNDDDQSESMNPYSNFNFINSSILVKMLLSINLWRETLLLNSINEECILKVTDFGLLPSSIIFRETEDYSVYTLEDYLSQNEADVYEDTLNEEDKKIDRDSISRSVSHQKSYDEEPTIFKRRKTDMSEDKSIELILKIIKLVETLHSKGIVHTNLNPCEIFFRVQDDLNTLCFNSLFYCSWDPKKLLKKKIPNTEDNPSIYDLTMRRKEYLSPEYIEYGEKFQQIGKDPSFYGMEKSQNPNFSNSELFQNMTFEESNRKIMNKIGKITTSCDIFSIGVILFKCLIGTTPPLSFYQSLSDYVNSKDIFEKKPSDNIYSPPAFLQKFILSDGMCYILTRLLHPDPSRRYQSLFEVRKVLLDLQNNLRAVPKLLQEVLGHPDVPNTQTLDSKTDEISSKKRRKSADQDGSDVSDFRYSKLSEFSLKYLAKFIYESHIDCIRINGGKLPLNMIKMNMIVDLDLSSNTLYSEDIFILSIYLKNTTVLKKISFARNFIGYKYLEESKVIELKIQNKEKIKDLSFEELFYDSLGIEHLSLALSKRPMLEYIDLSDNDIGPNNFKLLMKVFEVNLNIKFINISDSKINGDTVAQLCLILTKNKSLKSLLMRNCPIGDKGAKAVGQMIQNHVSLQELELFNCDISEKGGQYIGEALKTNFCIEKLSIGDNNLDQSNVEDILQSVIFNTQYNQLKESNRKFEDFAHELISECIKRWASTSDFVIDKLMIRLKHPQDELDRQIAQNMLDHDGKMSFDET